MSTYLALLVSWPINTSHDYSYNAELALQCLLISECEMEELVAQACRDSVAEQELSQACMHGDAEKVSLLVSNGAPVNTPYQGYLPLAVASTWGHTRVVEILLLKGAQVNLQEIEGNSALCCASSGGYTAIVKLLLDNGAQVDLQEILP